MRPNRASEGLAIARVVKSLEGIRVRSPSSWFVALALVCVAGPYVLGVRPQTRRERWYVAVAIAFLAWVLLLMASLRSM
jgi:hypothetical protein